MSAFSRYLSGEPISVDLFRQLCEEHDMAFIYTDDHEVWRHGDEQRLTMHKARRALGNATAIPIWNSVVDKKIGEAYREQFYWRLPE